MNKYNEYYFFNNIAKKMSDNKSDIYLILNEIYLFIQENKSYYYLNSFKDLEKIINQGHESNKIKNDQLKKCVEKLIMDIENEMKNIYIDYSYFEDKLRTIIFSIK